MLIHKHRPVLFQTLVFLAPTVVPQRPIRPLTAHALSRRARTHQLNEYHDSAAKVRPQWEHLGTICGWARDFTANLKSSFPAPSFTYLHLPVYQAQHGQAPCLDSRRMASQHPYPRRARLPAQRVPPHSPTEVKIGCVPPQRRVSIVKVCKVNYPCLSLEHEPWC